MLNQRYEATQERLHQDFRHDAERSAARWDKFLTPDDIPAIQVSAREAVAPAHPTSTEEDRDQAAWLHDFINRPEDASCPDGRDRSLDDWLAATFDEAILLGQDEEDETVPNVLNAACLSFYLLEPISSQCFSHTPIRFKDAL